MGRHKGKGGTPIKGAYCGPVPHCGGRSRSHTRIRSVYARSEGRCKYCNGEVFLSCHPIYNEVGRHARASVDHVVPVSKGGANSLTNYVLACMVCNEAKGNLDSY